MLLATPLKAAALSGLRARGSWPANARGENELAPTAGTAARFIEDTTG